MAVGGARATHAARAWGPVTGVVGKLERGGAVFAISASQFSAIDVLFAVLNKIGPAKLDLWTYAPGQAEITALGALVQEKRITALRLVLDQSGMHIRGVDLYKQIQQRFGVDCLRVTKAHAKLAALSTDSGWRVVIDGSANLAKNLRFEQVNIRDDPSLWRVVADLTTDLFTTAVPDLDSFNGAAARATVKWIGGDALGDTAPTEEAVDAGEADIDDLDVRRRLADGKLNLASADRIKANALALKHLLAARKAAGELIEIALAERVLFEEARAQRDAWANWPQRVGPMIAGDLGLPVDKVVEALEAHVHQQLAELGESDADFSGG